MDRLTPSTAGLILALAQPYAVIVRTAGRRLTALVRVPASLDGLEFHWLTDAELAEVTNAGYFGPGHSVPGGSYWPRAPEGAIDLPHLPRTNPARSVDVDLTRYAGELAALAAGGAPEHDCPLTWAVVDRALRTLGR